MPQSNEDKPGMLEKGVDHFQQNFPVYMSNDLIKVVSGIISPNASHAAAAFDAISRACSYISNCYNQSNNKGTGSNNIQEEEKPQHTEREEEVDFRRPHVVDDFVGRKDVLRKIKKTFNLY